MDYEFSSPEFEQILTKYLEYKICDDERFEKLDSNDFLRYAQVHHRVQAAFYGFVEYRVPKIL